MTFTFKLKEQERIANLSNCFDSLNFVTSEKDFNQGYKCTDYIRSVLRDVVPINTDSICYILADHIVVFKCNRSSLPCNNCEISIINGLVHHCPFFLYSAYSSH